MKLIYTILILIGILILQDNLIGQPENYHSEFSKSQTSEFQQNTPYNQKGLFNKLNSKGITFELNETLEGYYNFAGGIRSGTAWASTFDANVNLDLEKLLHLNGASIYFDFEDHHGDNPTSLLLGDAQIFDKHNAFPFTQIMEFWYEQELFHDKFRLKIGKSDANTDFSVIDNGLEFMNSTTQVSPTFFVFPTFPEPMPGISLFYNPGKIFNTSFAVYDADLNARFLEFYGSSSLDQLTLDGILLISESGLNWDQNSTKGLTGNFKLGLWKHTGTFTTFQGDDHKGAQGIYLILNQKLWAPGEANDIRGISTFLVYALSSSELSPIEMNYGGGICWNGPFDKRPEDICGISLQEALLSRELDLPKKSELNIEAFYKLQLLKWMDLKPDVQYIINPGGLYPNAFVGFLALNLNLNSYKE